jgi:hypothetical protein
LIENHILALGTNLAAPLIVDEAHEADKAEATYQYFNGPIYESPSPYHAPLLGEGETGFGDVREGVEEFPETWPQDETPIKTVTWEQEDALEPTYFDDVPQLIDTTVTTPKADPKPEADKVLFNLAERALARKAKAAAAFDEVAVVVNEAPVLIDLTGDDDDSEISAVCKFYFCTQLTCPC